MSDSLMIPAKGKMQDQTQIQLENWMDVYPNDPQLWWVVGAYPVSKHNSGRLFGPNKGETFRLTVSFDSKEEARDAFRKLRNGEATLLEYREKFWNREKDAQLIED